MKRPDYHAAPAGALSWGREVAELSDIAGAGLTAEQQVVVDDVFAVDPQFKPVAGEAVMVSTNRDEVTGTLAACALGWLYLCDVRTVAWSAWGRHAVRDTLDRLDVMVTGEPMLKSRVEKVVHLNGAESIRFRDGRRLVIIDRQKHSDAGRGLAVEKWVLDDAHYLDPRHMQDLMPALARAGSPQVVYGSAPWTPDVIGSVLQTLMTRGRAGQALSLAYAEWSK